MGVADDLKILARPRAVARGGKQERKRLGETRGPGFRIRLERLCFPLNLLFEE